MSLAVILLVLFSAPFINRIGETKLIRNLHYVVLNRLNTFIVGNGFTFETCFVYVKDNQRAVHLRNRCSNYPLSKP